MNKPGVTRNGKRPYDSRLRAEQAEATRKRILDAVEELLSEEGGPNLSIAAVARRAGVSAPTIYRNFKGREALLEAIDERVQKVLAPPPFSESLEQLPVHAIALYEAFGENEGLFRAGVEAGTIKEVRDFGKKKRIERLRKLVVGEAAHLPKRQAQSVAALVRLLISGDAWLRLTKELGLTSSEAGRVVGWALEVLVRDLREERETLVDPARIREAREIRKEAKRARGASEGDQ